LWLPKPYVWKEDMDIKKIFQHNPAKLKHSIFEETDRDWRVAQVSLYEIVLEILLQLCSRLFQEPATELQ
jgi:hypothetical protein